MLLLARFDAQLIGQPQYVVDAMERGLASLMASSSTEELRRYLRMALQP